MERLALAYRLRPGKREEYLKSHREIWPAVVKNLKDAGCHEISIFMRGNQLFLDGTVDSLERFLQREKDATYEEWDKWMYSMIEYPYDEDESSPFAVLGEIWRYDFDNEQTLVCADE